MQPQEGRGGQGAWEEHADRSQAIWNHQIQLLLLGGTLGKLYVTGPRFLHL